MKVGENNELSQGKKKSQTNLIFKIHILQKSPEPKEDFSWCLTKIQPHTFSSFSCSRGSPPLFLPPHHLSHQTRFFLPYNIATCSLCVFWVCWGWTNRAAPLRPGSCRCNGVSHSTCLCFAGVGMLIGSGLHPAPSYTCFQTTAALQCHDRAVKARKCTGCWSPHART